MRFPADLSTWIGYERFTTFAYLRVCHAEVPLIRDLLGNLGNLGNRSQPIEFEGRCGVSAVTGKVRRCSAVRARDDELLDLRVAFELDTFGTRAGQRERYEVDRRPERGVTTWAWASSDTLLRTAWWGTWRGRWSPMPRENAHDKGRPTDRGTRLDLRFADGRTVSVRCRGDTQPRSRPRL